MPHWPRNGSKISIDTLVSPTNNNSANEYKNHNEHLSSISICLIIIALVIKINAHDKWSRKLLNKDQLQPMHFKLPFHVSEQLITVYSMDHSYYTRKGGMLDPLLPNYLVYMHC